MFTATVVLSLLLAAAFIGAGVSKAIPVAMQAKTAAHLGYSVRAYRGIGLLELAGAAGLLIGLAVPFLGIAAAGGLVLLMLGAAISHLRVHDAIANIIPPLTLLALAAVTLVVRALSA